MDHFEQNRCVIGREFLFKTCGCCGRRWLLSLVLAGCAAAEEVGNPPGADPTDASLADGPPTAAPDAAGPCDPGGEGSPAECAAPGLLACAPEFVTETGECRPTPDRCPPGTLPVIDQGCEPVGIPGCATQFVGADGLCRPSLALCPPGMIPELATGCVAVGLPECAPLFRDANGGCRPHPELCPGDAVPLAALGCEPVGVQPCAPEFWLAGRCQPAADRCPWDAIPAPTSGCLPLGGTDACPATRWPSVPEDGAVTVYVDPAAEAEGDGSSARPVRTIQAALRTMPPPARLLLAAGPYQASVALVGELEVIGVCPARVVWAGTSAREPTATLSVAGRGRVTLRGLTLTGPGHGLVVQGDAQVTLEHVLVRNATSLGLLAQGPGVRLRLTDTLVREIRPGTEGLAWAISAEEGARVELQRSAVLRTSVFGVVSYGAGSLVSLTDCLIEATEPQASTGQYGSGLAVVAGGGGHAAQTVLLRNHGVGVLVGDPGSRLLLEESQVEATRPQVTDGSDGLGLLVARGGLARLDHVVVRESHASGVLLQEGGARLELRTSLVQGGRATAELPTGGGGVTLTDGTTALVTDSLLDDNQAVGLLAAGAGTELEVRDSVIARTRLKPDGELAGGMQVSRGAQARLERVALLDQAGFGLSVWDPMTQVELSRSLIAGNTARLAATDLAQPGVGLLVAAGGTLRSSRNAVVGNGQVELLIDDPGSRLESQGDLVTAGPQEADWPVAGLGLGIAGQGQAFVVGSAFVANQALGIAVEDPGSELSLEASLVEGTRARRPDGKYGNNLQIQRGARASLTRCAVLDGASVGVLAADPESELELTECVVGNRASALAAPGQFGIFLDRAQARLVHNAITDNQWYGLVAQGEGATLHSRRDLIRGTRSPANVAELTLPRGLGIDRGAQGVLEGTVLVDNASLGLTVIGLGSRATATGLLVTGTRAVADAGGGLGVYQSDGSSFELADSGLLANQTMGLYVTSLLPDLQARAQPTRAHLTRVVIAGTRTHPAGTWGGGLLVDGRSQLELTASRLEDNQVFGVLVHAATATLTRTVIARTGAGTIVDPDGQPHAQVGDGLLALNGADCTLRNVFLLDQARAGLLFDDSRGLLEGCRATSNGFGLVLQHGSSLRGIESCTWEDNRHGDLWTDAPLAVPDQPVSTPPPGAIPRPTPEG